MSSCRRTERRRLRASVTFQHTYHIKALALIRAGVRANSSGPQRNLAIGEIAEEPRGKKTKIPISGNIIPNGLMTSVGKMMKNTFSQKPGSIVMLELFIISN